MLEVIIVNDLTHILILGPQDFTKTSLLYMNWPEENYTDILAKLNEINITYELSKDNFHNDKIDIKQVSNKQLGEEHQMLQNEKNFAD